MIEVNLREASSGNVFANLNMEEPTLYLAKAQLANQICEIVREQNLSQVRNASAFASRARLEKSPASSKEAVCTYVLRRRSER